MPIQRRFTVHARRRAPLRPPRAAHAVAAFAAATLLLACGPEGKSGPSFHGVILSAPMPKPSFTLTDFNGHPYDFAAETKGKVALLFFGYTHCPDVCPLHMANIAAVLHQMPWEERSNIVTVFVTTDPARDTPQRLKEWLGAFDPSFVGLTGSDSALAAAQRLVGLPVAAREYTGPDSSEYSVGHAAQVLAFSRDGYAYLEYPFGVRQEDWANDLPRLARDSTGSDTRRELAADARAQPAQAAASPGAPPDIATRGLVVTHAVIAQPATTSEAALYLTLKNDNAQADTLVAIACELAGRAEIHETMSEGGMQHMMPMGPLPIPARTVTRLAPGGRHVMLFDLRKPLRAGDEVTIYLSFARVGAVRTRATVVAYPDLEKALSDSAGAAPR